MIVVGDSEGVGEVVIKRKIGLVVIVERAIAAAGSVRLRRIVVRLPKPVHFAVVVIFV